MLVVASDAHQAHHSLEFSDGVVGPSVESPDRADMIAAALRSAGHDFAEPEPLDTTLLAKIHTAEYIEFLTTAWERWEARGTPNAAAIGFTWPTRGLHAVRPDDLIGQLGFHSFAADCSIVAGTWDAAQSAASIAMTAADAMLDTNAVTFGLCRPPGHHATADQFGGYCYLNNAAVAAQRLLDRGAKRIAILDIDYHHGNGTQAIFYDRADVLFVSLHADPMVEFPWFAGHADEVGTGSGDGWNLNLPLPPGTDIEGFSAALKIGLDRIASAGVDAVVVSLGVDTYEHDPLSTFKIRSEDFAVLGDQIHQRAFQAVILQEGGYAVGDLGTNVATFLNPLS